MDINKTYFGDSMELIKTVPDNFINLVVTSPPYADVKNYGKNVSTLSPRNYNDWFLPLAKEIGRTLTEDGSFILNINDKVIGGFRDLYVYELVIRICKETDLKLYERYCWYKKNALPTSGNRLNDWMEYIFHFTKSPKIKARVDNVREPYAESTIKRYKSPVAFNETVDDNGLTTTMDGKLVTENPLGKKPSTVFRFNNAGVLKGETAGKHPAPFHPDLPEFFIKFLTDPNDIVLDPFMGSGTVAEVCEKYGRNWIGMELNESYGNLIDIRVKKAVKNEEFIKSELIRLSIPPKPRKIKNVIIEEENGGIIVEVDEENDVILNSDVTNEMNGSDEVKEEYKKEWKKVAGNDVGLLDEIEIDPSKVIIVEPVMIKENKSKPVNEIEDEDWFDKL